MTKQKPVASCCGGGCACGASEPGLGIQTTTSRLSLADFLGTVRVRLGIGRDKYRIPPALYRLGRPDRSSPVFASANYKLSFDALRSSLEGSDAWILVLDTRGVNVWCAAGKGTFGTEELVNRIREVRLAGQVEDKKIILPQLAAPGVAAHEVEKRTGFRVFFGPVRAADIKAYLQNGLKADPMMRRIGFGLRDRAQLVFVEFAGTLKIFLPVAGVILLLVLLFRGSPRFLPDAGRAVIGVVVALASGTVLVPIALPWLPGRSFSFKGLFAGLLAGLVFVLLAGYAPLPAGAWVLVISAVSSFLAMGFTGASTYTNLSGTIREMTIYIPIQIIAFSAGMLLFITMAIINAAGG